MRAVIPGAPLLALMLIAGGARAQESPTEGFVNRPDGARIHYEIRGTGSPMVLIHGYPLNLGLFRDNVAVLANAGYAVVTASLRGFGESETPSDEIRIDTYSDDMLAVMDQLQIDKAIVLGMSMGGWTLFDMYKKAPERFSALIFNDTAATPPTVAEEAFWRGLADQARQEGPASLVPVLMKDMLTGRTRLENRELVDYLSGLMEEASVDGAAGGAMALATRPDLTSVMQSIDVPALLLFGIEDTLTPVGIAREMEKSISNAELFTIDGASHASIIESAGVANQAILDWIDRVDIEC